MELLRLDDLNHIPVPALKRMSPLRFGELLDAAPPHERPLQWRALQPGTLQYLPPECHEELLARLPQCGAIKNRKPGTLRVLSVGFHAHIAAADHDHPYEADFFVRCSGCHGVTNLLIQPCADRFRPDMLAHMDCGPEAHFFEVMHYLAERHGLKYLDHYELILLRMFRPGSPHCLQWGTVGGVFSADEERRGWPAAQERACAEIEEELQGYRIYGWGSLVNNGVYQANVAELQHVSVTIGFIPDRQRVRLDHTEGITEFETVRLSRAQGFFHDLKAVPLHRSTCILPDEKMVHGLEILLRRLAEIGIHRKIRPAQ